MADLLSSTSWHLIRDAADGRRWSRAEFVRRYAPVIRAYLGARWRTDPLRSLLDDGIQQVFLECFQSGGALEKVHEGRPGGFRGFLFGVVRNVARSLERRHSRPDAQVAAEAPPHPEEPTAEQAFDQAWARAVLREALDLQARRALDEGPEAGRRVLLLRQRFYEGLPVREIAKSWKRDPAWLHRQVGQAKNEFRRALQEVLTYHCPMPDGEAPAFAALGALLE